MQLQTHRSMKAELFQKSLVSSAAVWKVPVEITAACNHGVTDVWHNTTDCNFLSHMINHVSLFRRLDDENVLAKAQHIEA